MYFGHLSRLVKTLFANCYYARDEFLQPKNIFADDSIEIFVCLFDIGQNMSIKFIPVNTYQFIVMQVLFLGNFVTAND